MHVIYKLINIQKEANNNFPCYYIGSKLNYIPGTYWGSSKHPTLIEELKTNVSNFKIEILEYVDNPTDLTTRERVYQLDYDVLNNPKYYNLHLANEKFTSSGRKWYYDPLTLNKGYFQDNKIPAGWIRGYKPEDAQSKKYKQVNRSKPTGLKKNDPKLHEQISNSVANTYWVLRDPNGILHTVTKLHKFCEEHNLSPQLRLNKNFGIPLKKGNSKGWCVIDKKSCPQAAFNCMFDNKAHTCPGGVVS